jgi:ABC-type sugar transport system permease subunit
MKHKTFFWFILPTLTAMILFIALPIVSVIIQSLHIEHEQVLITVENCGPSAAPKTVAVDQEATEGAARGRRSAGSTGSAPTPTARIWLSARSGRPGAPPTPWARSWTGDEPAVLRALAFTLTYTFVVTPFVLVLGLAIAVGVNNLPKMFKGVTIFMSLLPMMVPPWWAR